MRIALVSREFAPFHGSGVGVYAAEAARAWTAAGHEVHVLTGDHPGLSEGAAALFPGVRVHSLDLQDGMAERLPEPRGAIQWPLGVLERLTDLHARTPFDLIEFPDLHGEGSLAIRARRLEGALPGAVLAVRLHMPTFLIDHANQRVWRGRLRAYLHELEREAIAGADLVFAPCRAVAEAIEGLGVELGRAGRAVVVSANPFVPGARHDYEASHAADAPRAADADGPPPQDSNDEVVFIGRLERRKGVDVLVRAAVRLLRGRPTTTVRLIGKDTDTGPLDTSVARWLADTIPIELRERIVLEGHVERDRAIAAAERAAVLCFPAIWDNWPYAVLEAMAAGRCIVASNAGGHAEMLEHERTALLVEPGDAEGLAAALARALDGAGLRASLGAAARVRAIEWGDPDRFARETIEAVEKAKRGLNTEAQRHGAGTEVKRGEESQSQGRSRIATTASDVTVVIPHRDMGSLLIEALESLDQQSLPGCNVIVVDDGSEHPRTTAVLDRLKREGFGTLDLRLLRHAAPGKSQGPAAVRNAGIHSTTTDFVLTLDADDLLDPDCIHRLLAVMRRDPSLACCGSFVSYFEESPDRPVGAWGPLGLVPDMLGAINTMGTGSGILFRRDALLALRPNLTSGGPFDTTMPGYEDWELYAALAAAGRRAEIVPAYLVNYRVRPGSRYRLDKRRHDFLVAEIAARHPTLATGAALRLALAEARERRRASRGTFEKALNKLRRERDRLRRKVERLQTRQPTEAPEPPAIEQPPRGVRGAVRRMIGR
ncbi:MAG: glycosyltransferase [Phycisphaerales bacterium]